MAEQLGIQSWCRWVRRETRPQPRPVCLLPMPPAPPLPILCSPEVRPAQEDSRQQPRSALPSGPSRPPPAQSVVRALTASSPGPGPPEPRRGGWGGTSPLPWAEAEPGGKHSATVLSAAGLPRPDCRLAAVAWALWGLGQEVASAGSSGSPQQREVCEAQQHPSAPLLFLPCCTKKFVFTLIAEGRRGVAVGATRSMVE